MPAARVQHVVHSAVVVLGEPMSETESEVALLTGNEVRHGSMLARFAALVFGFLPFLLFSHFCLLF